MFTLQRKIIVKYVIFLMTISIVPLLVTGFISYQISSRTLQNAESHFSQVLLNDQKELLELQLKQVENLISNISGVELITRALDDSDNKVDTYTSLATQARIGYILNGYLHMQGLVSIDIFTEGGAHYHVGDTLDISEIRASTKDLIRSGAMQSNKQFYWPGVVPNVNKASSHQKVVAAARIISKTDRQTLKKRPIALLLVNYSLEYLHEYFSRIELGADTTLALLDQNRNIIYAKDPEDLDYSTNEIISHLTENEQIPDMISWQNEDYFIQSQKLQNPGWQLLSITPEHALLSGVWTIRDTTALLLLIAFIIVGFASLLFSRKVVRPIRDVINGYKQLENNAFNLDIRLPVRSNDEIGELVKWFNSFIDNLSSRQTTEAHLHTLLESLPDLVWMKDTDGMYLVCNPKFEHLLGLERTEIIGKTDYDLVEKELAEFIHENDKAVMADCASNLKEQEVTFGDDGHKELLETVKTPIFSPDGKLIGILGVGRDITERRQAEQGMRRAQKMDAIGQLTGGIAHDFNNLLAIIIGNLELLKMQIIGNEKATKRIGSIQKAADRAANLTKQLLGFSRQHASQMTVTDITEIIVGMENLITRSLTPEVEIEEKFTQYLWKTEIDAGDFQDSLLNLCLNARDAMSGKGHLTIETSNTTLDDEFCSHNPGSKPGQYVQLVISDDGSGIPEDQVEHIFEPFFTTKDQGKGTGLGLAMVYGFISRSGGYIKCDSKESVGTTFRIYLPRSEAEIVNIDLDHNPNETLPQGNETVLAVDDEADLLELVREMLEELGYRVLTASDGNQALKMLEKYPSINLLFSDVVMPGGVNGYELAKLAAFNNPKLKILLASGYTGKFDKDSELSHLSTALLRKPYAKSELANQVRATLDSVTG